MSVWPPPGGTRTGTGFLRVAPSAATCQLGGSGAPSGAPSSARRTSALAWGPRPGHRLVASPRPQGDYPPTDARGADREGGGRVATLRACAHTWADQGSRHFSSTPSQTPASPWRATCPSIHAAGQLTRRDARTAGRARVALSNSPPLHLWRSARTGLSLPFLFAVRWLSHSCAPRDSPESAWRCSPPELRHRPHPVYPVLTFPFRRRERSIAISPWVTTRTSMRQSMAGRIREGEPSEASRLRDRGHLDRVASAV
jgi:hypothetical protein